jgi:hypothetical protein
MGVRLTLCNGTLMDLSKPPLTTLSVNGKEEAWDRVDLAPGLLAIRVVFSPEWELAQSEASLELHVATLTALRILAPTRLLQVHCSRRWEKGRVTTEAVLSDGFKSAVHADLVADGTFLRLDPLQRVIEAAWPGLGWVNGSFGGLPASASVEVVLESLLVANLSIQGIPEAWTAPLLGKLALRVTLWPAVEADGLVHWSVVPAGVLEVSSHGELILKSDHYEEVIVTAGIRSCQGQAAHSVSVSTRVNVIPDQPWQIDVGGDTAPPLEMVPVGSEMHVPIYVMCFQALQAFTAMVSLPGVETGCAPGSLATSQCFVRKGFVELTGNFTESRRTGRILLGVLKGSVLVNGLSRLRISLSMPVETTYEFTVRLGVEPVHSVLTRLNTVTQGASKPTITAWDAASPEGLWVCCDVLAARSGSVIAHLAPSSFRLQSIELRPSGASIALTDPRLQVEFDESVLEFDADTSMWTVTRFAWASEETTFITLKYRHPGALEVRDARVTVILAFPGALAFEPPNITLRRLHCDEHAFQSAVVAAKLLLVDGSFLTLGEADLSDVSVGREATVFPSRNGLLVTGVSVGETVLVLKVFGLTGRMAISVVDASSLVRRVTIPDPYILEGAQGVGENLNMTAVFDDGQTISSAAFLVNAVVAEGSFAVWRDQQLVALRNTHPRDHPSLSVTVGACGGKEAVLVTARLYVRLKVRLTLAQPADVCVTSNGVELSVTLFADTVSSFLITLFLGGSGVFLCKPGPDLPALADCSAEDGGMLLLAGAFSSPRVGPVTLATISPVPESVSGVVEFFSGFTGCVRLPVVAGLLGQPAGLSLLNILPAVDPGTLARLYAVALARPWDRQAMQDTRFTLQLLTNRQRLVDTRLYSNEVELSAMFWVTDRFFQPDTNGTSMDVVFHTGLLPSHPEGVSVPEGLMVPARHVVDGWYAVQWVDVIPRMDLFVSFRVSSRTSLAAWEHVAQKPLATGRPLRACPRLATDRASFLAVFRLAGMLPVDWAAKFGCTVHVPARRISVNGPDSRGGVSVSVAVESFIRTHQVFTAFEMALPQRRLLQDAPRVEQVTLSYINDTADSSIPCPPGMYFWEENGTYVKLPLHGLVGEDCYGMHCQDGYTFDGVGCVPLPVPLGLVWVSVIVAFGVMLVCSCVLCALHLGNKTSTPAPVDLVSESWPGSSHPSEILLDHDDDAEFKNIVLGFSLDDLSSDVLDEDESAFASCRAAKA